ncbi:MAG: hypothetical protein F6K41_18465 [Symploca sp. SIO3E6]|nr:hypothetical protein [Caldora sp. SIO3E6]
MSVDVNNISINIAPEGFDGWLDYADMLQELADELDAFRNCHRSSLQSAQRNRLRLETNEIRQKARAIATISAINTLQNFEQDLASLREITGKIDKFIKKVENVQAIISGIGEIMGVITNILTLVA